MNNRRSALSSPKGSKGKILVAYHKKYPLLSRDFFCPIHVGRASFEMTKDGEINAEERQWLEENLMGDNSGDNISQKNREYSECTGLYWFWKNYDYRHLEYVGAFQYRRQLILNELFARAINDKEKQVYKCVHLNKNSDICTIAGIEENRILEILEKYDYIIPYRTSLEKMGINSIYEDYVKCIPGVHVSDILILEEIFARKYPEKIDKLMDYLKSPNKLMYQIFITKPELFNNYCEWLFDLLFAIDPFVDVSLYDVNGKRTMGYLAEILYGFYFTFIVPDSMVLETGVTYLE